MKKKLIIALKLFIALTVLVSLSNRLVCVLNGQEIARLTTKQQLGIGKIAPEYDVDIFDIKTNTRVGFAKYNKKQDLFEWTIIDTVKTFQAMQRMLEGMVRQQAN